MGFNKELSKKIALETMGTDSGPADSQGIEIKSPGKMHWFTVKGQTFDELTQITTTQLYDWFQKESVNFRILSDVNPSDKRFERIKTIGEI